MNLLMLMLLTLKSTKQLILVLQVDLVDHIDKEHQVDLVGHIDKEHQVV